MSSDVDNSNMSRKSHKLLPLSEKMKAIYLMRKEKNHMQLLGFPVRTNLLSMKLWRKKKICPGFAVASQTIKVMPRVTDKSFVKIEKALNLYSKIFWAR